MGRRPRRIALLHHTGGGNLGDQASVDVVLGNIRWRWPDSTIVLLSMNPSETTRIHGVPSYPLRTYTWEIGYMSGATEPNSESALRFTRWLRTTRTPLLRVLRAVLREIAFLIGTLRNVMNFDLLVVSGGGQLTGKSGPWGFPYTIFLWILAAKVAGKRSMFLNVGAGPLSDRLTKFFVTRALYAADYVSFRDQPSQALARKSGFEAESQVFPDNVYGLEVCTPSIRDTRKREQPVVGISPLAYPNDSIFSAQEQITTYPEVISKFAFFASSLTRRSYSIAFFGTDFGEDPATIEDLRSALRDRYNIATPSYKRVEVVHELLEKMSAMDYIVTCRFHGVVFAHLLNKPVLAISPHPKVTDLMSALGLSRYCVDIQTFDSHELLDTFEALARERDAIKQRMAANLSNCRLLIKRQFDDLFPANPNHALVVPRLSGSAGQSNALGTSEHRVPGRRG